MKQFFTLILSIVFLSSFTTSFSIEEVVTAMKTGNASAVATYFDNTVEITLPDKGNSFSKSQAQMVLQDFFTNNPVKTFEVIHKGQNAGSQYCIGTLVTKNGSFRTTIYMKQKGNAQLIQEMRFESR